MFLNIREEDIRADCPHNAPMTLRAFNKISPRQFNTSVSPLNPFEIPRYAPTTVGQFSKALLQQQGQTASQMTSSLSIPVIEEAILAETDVEDFIIDFGDENIEVEIDPMLLVDDVAIQEEEKEELAPIDVEIDQLISIKDKTETDSKKLAKKVRINVRKNRKTLPKLRGAEEYLDERRDPNEDLSDEMRLRSLERERGMDLGGTDGAPRSEGY
tara:strand:+ start:244 stop:885 length:642 start_codon:yes stop_codon:yes gene_type:complete